MYLRAVVRSWPCNLSSGGTALDLAKLHVAPHCGNVNQQVADALYFQACRTVDGHAHRIATVRRNRMAAVVLSPEWMDGGPAWVAPGDWFDNSKYYVNLNDVESRTWRQVLTGMSLSTIAREECVSRQAIYSRIAGTRGYGGMISKNFWVLLWWRCRQNLR